MRQGLTEVKRMEASARGLPMVIKKKSGKKKRGASDLKKIALR